MVVDVGLQRYALFCWPCWSPTSGGADFWPAPSFLNSEHRALAPNQPPFLPSQLTPLLTLPCVWQFPNVAACSGTTGYDADCMSAVACPLTPSLA